MSNIEFDTDQQFRRQAYATQQQRNSGGMAGWLVKKGIIKDESQAGGILMGIVLVNFILMGFVIYYFVL